MCGGVTEQEGGREQKRGKWEMSTVGAQGGAGVGETGREREIRLCFYVFCKAER